MGGDDESRAPPCLLVGRPLRRPTFRPTAGDDPAVASSEVWLSGPQAARLLDQLHTVHALIDPGELAADILRPGKRSAGWRRVIRIQR